MGDKTNGTQTIVPIVDGNGLPTKIPWPLLQGKEKPNATDAADVLDFQPYKPTSWTPLNFS